MIYDKSSGHSQDRKAFSEHLKKFTANPNPDQRIEDKGKTAINVRLNRRVSIVVNTGARNLNLLPEDTEDMRDKVIILRSHKVTCLKGSIVENNATIAAQIAAFAWWLENEYVAPAHVMGDARFCVRAYVNTELADERRFTSTAYHIETLLIDYLQSVEMPEWKASVSEIYKALSQYDRHLLDKLIMHLNGFVNVLQELSKNGSFIVQYIQRKDVSRWYRLTAVIAQKTGVTGAKVIPGTF